MSVVVRCIEGTEFGIPSLVFVVGTTTFYRREISNDNQPIWTNLAKLNDLFRIHQNTVGAGGKTFTCEGLRSCHIGII